VVVCFVSDMKHQEAWSRVVVSMYMARNQIRVVAFNVPQLTQARENKGEWFGMMYLLGAIWRL
jgi:hypothetical protein